MSRIWLPAASLWRREMVRFFRQRSRVIGSLATPLFFWVLFSTGYGPSFQPDGATSAGVAGSFVWFLPGTITLILLFTSIFANISVIEDRKEGFLQGVLVAPVPRTAIVLGKVLGGATIAALQAFLLIGVALVAGLESGVAHPGALAGAVVLVSVSLSALGFCFAWRLDSVQAFHGVMNMVLMPLWILSGALFPAAGTPWLLRTLIQANPVTYGLEMMRQALGVATPNGPSPALALAVTAGFALVTFGAAVVIARMRTKG